jgi:hypothetical protein
MWSVRWAGSRTGAGAVKNQRKRERKHGHSQDGRRLSVKRELGLGLHCGQPERTAEKVVLPLAA